MRVSADRRRHGRALMAAMFAAFAPYEALALPIGFGTNQGPLEYSELTSPHFNVYFDARVPTEGQAALAALEGARPHVESWLGVGRGRPLPVVMSAVTDNASFANFIADAIELQTLGFGPKDLAWHEFVHASMYRHLDNLFGPAGAVLHLPWMPAWFLEGLAEALSVSAGSDQTGGIERYQAMSGDWPTYDRLHSLYSKYDFAERGYATSGAFVRWIMARSDPARLPALLASFRKYSMPWWWPWAAVPWNGFMPMDEALEGFTGAKAAALYEEYKTAAAAHWRATRLGPYLLGEKAQRRDFSGTAGLQSDGKDVRHLEVSGGRTWEVGLTFDDSTGWVTGTRKIRALPAGYTSYARAIGGGRLAAVAYRRERTGDFSTLKVRELKGGGTVRELDRQGTILGLWMTPDGLVWLEHDLAAHRICQIQWNEPSKAPVCPAAVNVPARLRALGVKPHAPGSGLAAEIWFGMTEERLPGNRHSVWVYDAVTRQVRRDRYETVGQPVALAYAGAKPWLLVAERNRRTLRQYDDTGVCRAMLGFQDHLVDLEGTADGRLVVAVYGGAKTHLRRVPTDNAGACDGEDAPTSPIQEALRLGGQPDLKTALAAAAAWGPPSTPPTPAARQALAKAPPLDKDLPPGISGEPVPAKWRGKPLFLFPWIGAEDALGPQFGIVSVPLMDQMQNESVRATFLYGAASRFPYQEVAVTSGRFIPSLSLAGYRQQTYNGRFIRRTTGEIQESFLDEKGARLESDTAFRALGGSASFGLGIKYAHLKPYIGPEVNGHGWLAEPGSSLGITHTFGRFTWTNSLSGRIAPAQLNEEFDYNQVGASTTVGAALPFLASRLSLGLEGSRTRGKKMRDLREVYRPLKTFVPGSGGGYNQNSFPVVDGGGLFAAVFGNTQGRAKANWTMPLIADMDKQWWIIYLERLDFTAFYNYGAAWSGAEPARGWDRLIRAHGYNVDLQMENKGVRFNAGLGTGQVVGRDFEIYMTTGFDALF